MKDYRKKWGHVFKQFDMVDLLKPEEELVAAYFINYYMTKNKTKINGLARASLFPHVLCSVVATAVALRNGEHHMHPKMRAVQEVGGVQVGGKK